MIRSIATVQKKMNCYTINDNDSKRRFFLFSLKILKKITQTLLCIQQNQQIQKSNRFHLARNSSGCLPPIYRQRKNHAAISSGALFPVIDKPFRPWYPILFEHQPINETGDYRLLQVKFTSGIDLLQTEWLQEIQQMLPHVVDPFVTEDSALIVEQRAGENLRLDELDGLFVALDMDFDCYRIYL